MDGSSYFGFDDANKTKRIFYFILHVRLIPNIQVVTSNYDTLDRFTWQSVTKSLHLIFTGPRRIPHIKASDAELWCFLWSARLSKQSWGWWFETPSCSLWRHCNADAHLKHANLMQSDAQLRRVISMYWAHWCCQVKPTHCIPHRHQIVLCTNDLIRVLNRRVTSNPRARRRDAGILIHSARFRGSV